ncbi:hypothetical protein AZE42_07313 [Rhizopogon vesiculosus]|uniref:JmjC domain-containing protein n=1 Tax=Rhizopogon vesiculosus TaxID=180088 RepID=A0A1J8R3I1_9AGAM|nr:hypothetical protein AZE42_07313 [Rhizopogon vesiculosus]
METTTNLDLTCGLLGTQVPVKSGQITWKDGHTTILPAVYDDFAINVAAVDIPMITFIAQFPSSTPESTYVHHLTNVDLQSDTILDVVGEALSQNKPVVIRGVDHKDLGSQFTAGDLDEHFGISPNRAVCIHDLKARSNDHTMPTIPGTVASFCNSILDPTKIQCVLDLRLAHVSLPESLSKLDHGLVHGWNETMYDCPISSDVHPENFTVKGWGLLHHAGIYTGAHYDAEGTLTWIRMEVGVKYWVVFKPKTKHNNRLHLQQFACRLVDFDDQNLEWYREHCDIEVITLYAGDLLILPPGTVHAVYTPVASFATGGHFYHYGCMHLSELARYIDSDVGNSTTNQNLDHALETLRRMVIAIPRLSPRIMLFERSLLSICIMATKGEEYRAKGGSKHSVLDRETAQPSAEVSNAIFKKSVFAWASNRQGCTAEGIDKIYAIVVY